MRSTLRGALSLTRSAMNSGTNSMHIRRCFTSWRSSCDSLYDDFVRCGIQLCEERLEEQDRDWDWYFLMQHHGAPTRLLDWSDGALSALHFALQNKSNRDNADAHVYVLEPYRLKDRIEALPEIEMVKQSWGRYIENHPFHKSREDEWEYAYLPSDEEDLKELPIPGVPLLLHFPHITRRVAASAVASLCLALNRLGFPSTLPALIAPDHVDRSGELPLHLLVRRRWRLAFRARKLLSLDLPGRVHRQNPFFGKPGKQHPNRGHMLLDSRRRA